MRDIDRKCMSCIILALVWFPIISSQMFDKRPTIYDHMKSGANTVKTNLIDSELKVETEFLPENCKVDEDNFFEDRDEAIALAKYQLRQISAEEGDTVVLKYTVKLESDGSVLDKSEKESEELGGEDIFTPAIFTLGHGMVIYGWELGVKGMCIGEIRRITIPPQLAYGSKGYKEKNVPADATLEIETELVSLKKKGAVDYYMDFLHNLHVYAFFILGLTFLMSGYYKGQLAVKRRMYREIIEKKRRREEGDEEEETEEEEEYIEEGLEDEFGEGPEYGFGKGPEDEFGEGQENEFWDGSEYQMGLELGEEMEETEKDDDL